MHNPSPFELAGHQNPEVKITHDANRLSDGARDVLERFNDADRKRIQNAKKLNISEAQIAIPSRGVTTPDIELAVLISGLERASAPESAMVEFLNTIKITNNNHDKVWLKNLRKAVKHILASEQRTEGRGFDPNVVNEDDHLTLNRPGFTGGQNSRRIARYGTCTKEEDVEAVFTRVPRTRGAAFAGTPR